MQNKFKSIYIKISQKVIYLILQKLLHYPKIIKLKGYKKLIIQIFAEIKYFCKRLQMVITLGQDLQDTIAIVIALDSLYNDFNTNTASLLEAGNKTINQIQSFLLSKKVKNISKQVIENISNLAKIFRNSSNATKKRQIAIKNATIAIIWDTLEQTASFRTNKSINLFNNGKNKEKNKAKDVLIIKINLMYNYVHWIEFTSLQN